MNYSYYIRLIKTAKCLRLSYKHRILTKAGMEILSRTTDVSNHSERTAIIEDLNEDVRSRILEK